MVPVLHGPATAADADRGFDLAARWCNGCHSIGDDPQRQEDAGTPFAELARNDEIYLRSAINHPHEFMPDFPQLTDTDKGDLIAYIRSLGG
ncbi:MAG TPA: cytochrome c [Afifellaceae bacterium]|nr:cytochrome c [Afifellaceae bacterium]